MDTPDIGNLPEMKDDDMLEFTQLYRRKFVATVTNNGTIIPTDPKEAKVFLAALSDMDRTVLSKKRLKVEEDANKLTAQAIADLAAQVADAIKANPLPPNTSSRTLTLDDEALPPLTLVPGETEIGIRSETMEDFKNRVSAENPGMLKNNT